MERQSLEFLGHGPWLSKWWFRKKPENDGFETGVSFVSCFHLNLHFSQIFRKPKYPRPISFPSFYNGNDRKCYDQKSKSKWWHQCAYQSPTHKGPQKLHPRTLLSNPPGLPLMPSSIQQHDYRSRPVPARSVSCRFWGGSRGSCISMITAKVGTLQPSKPPQVPRAWRPDAEQCHRHSAPPPDERYCALEKGSGCKGDFDTSELFLRASMDFPCVSSGPQCCWTLFGVVLFKPLRIYSFHNLNLTKLANCRKAPTLDGNWWLGHCKIMFVKNYPKSSSIFGVKNRDENLHWNQPVKSGFRNPPVTPAPPALWCTGSRPRPSHAARPPVRVAGSELLGWPRSRHAMRKGHVLKFYPSKTRWTYPSTSDHFHELNWTPGLQKQLFVISKNGKLHFHQLAFFRSFESLTTSWGSSNMPRKVGVPVPMRSPRVVITQVVPGGKSCTFKMCRCCCLCFIYSVHICTYMYMYVYVHVCKYHTCIYIYDYIWMYSQ